MSTATPPSETDNVSPEQAREIASAVSKYIKVGIASIFFTILTVTLSYITKGNILVAMVLATINGSLILYYTMHLKSEKPSVIRTAWISLFFFVEMILVTLLAYSDRIHL